MDSSYIKEALLGFRLPLPTSEDMQHMKTHKRADWLSSEQTTKEVGDYYWFSFMPDNTLFWQYEELQVVSKIDFKSAHSGMPRLS